MVSKEKFVNYCVFIMEITKSIEMRLNNREKYLCLYPLDSLVRFKVSFLFLFQVGAFITHQRKKSVIDHLKMYQ